MSGDYLKQVTIGKVKEVNGSIELSPYQKTWEKDYAFLKRLITNALKGQEIAIEHVGSTAVEGLTAKPIIDVILFVKDPNKETDYVPALKQAGFTLRIREEDLYEHRMFTYDAPQAHVHVFCFGCIEAKFMIAFRDLLRTHHDEKVHCEKTKQKLARQNWHYVQDYADAKTGVIKKILSLNYKQ